MCKEVIELCTLDIDVYKCISEKISTDRVVLTDKQIIHMENRHPDAYDEVLELLRDTITDPDYIICDEKHEETGLVVRKEYSKIGGDHIFIVLRIRTDTDNSDYANSVISGWKISEKRLQSYLRNKTVLYRRSEC